MNQKVVITKYSVSPYRKDSYESSGAVEKMIIVIKVVVIVINLQT